MEGHIRVRFGYDRVLQSSSHGRRTKPSRKPGNRTKPAGSDWYLGLRKNNLKPERLL